MKKIILILITIIFTTNVSAHSTKNITPNMDSKQECRKKKSALNYISKHKLFKLKPKGSHYAGPHVIELVLQVIPQEHLDVDIMSCHGQSPLGQ